METRTIKTDLKADSKRVTGYAIVFNSPATITGERAKAFTEVVKPGSVNLAPDLRLLWNHESGNVLGSVASGTLKVTTDERGLHFDATLPESAAREREALARGDVDGMSFGFMVRKDKWTDNTRELQDIYVQEISITPFPAYKQTTANLRSKNFARLQLAEKEIL